MLIICGWLERTPPDAWPNAMLASKIINTNSVVFIGLSRIQEGRVQPQGHGKHIIPLQLRDNISTELQEFSQLGEIGPLPKSLSRDGLRKLCSRCMVRSSSDFSIMFKYFSNRIRASMRFAAVWLCLPGILLVAAHAQTDCVEGDNILDTTPPKGMSPQELIQKLVANEDKVQAARLHYTFTQNVLVQTLDGKSVDGQFHEITNISYDDRAKRVEKVSFAEQSTLRDIQLSETDKDDIRTFMPWILTSEQAPQYNLTYAGKQHVDDLETYVFHVEPKTLEKNKRYFQGRIWVDDRDLEVVKLCGKSVPEAIAKKKKNQPVEVRPTFVAYRQIVDGNWFPAYARVDDTLHFGVGSVHVREIVKFTGYKRAGTTETAAKP